MSNQEKDSMEYGELTDILISFENGSLSLTETYSLIDSKFKSLKEENKAYKLQSGELDPLLLKETAKRTDLPTSEQMEAWCAEYWFQEWKSLKEENESLQQQVEEMKHRAFRLGAKAAGWSLKRTGEPQPKKIWPGQEWEEWIDELIEINEEQIQAIKLIKKDEKHTRE